MRLQTVEESQKSRESSVSDILRYLDVRSKSNSSLANPLNWRRYVAVTAANGYNSC